MGMFFFFLGREFDDGLVMLNEAYKEDGVEEADKTVPKKE